MFFSPRPSNRWGGIQRRLPCCARHQARHRTQLNRMAGQPSETPGSGRSNSISAKAGRHRIKASPSAGRALWQPLNAAGRAPTFRSGSRRVSRGSPNRRKARTAMALFLRLNRSDREEDWSVIHRGCIEYSSSAFQYRDEQRKTPQGRPFIGGSEWSLLAGSHLAPSRKVPNVQMTPGH